MSYSWTAKQFVGGTVALDFANTVCYRGDPARRFDKLAEAAELVRFAEAASDLSDAGGWRSVTSASADDVLALTLYRELRERIDALFRPVAKAEAPDSAAFRALLRIYQDLLQHQELRVGAAGIEIDPASQPRFALVLAQSSLRLAGSAEMQRVKHCPNCDWLFIDRSRNGSRIWCDMLTCGNQAKARRLRSRRRSRPPA